MAKKRKSRTPAPPKRPAAPRSSDGRGGNGARTVQAPQVRSGKRRTQTDVERRNRLILYGIAGLGLAGLAAALILVFAVGRGSSVAPHDDGPSVDFANLPGLLKGPPPWPANSKQLPARAKRLGVALSATEGEVLHIHQHLDVYDNGKHVKVPQFVGISRKGTSYELAELHTHSGDGVIHLESTRPQAASLGQFFGVWGVYLSPSCIGGLCASPGKPFRVYVDGRLFRGNPVTLVLQQHQEIAFVYGKPPTHIPSSYNFAQGE